MKKCVFHAKHGKIKRSCIVKQKSALCIICEHQKQPCSSYRNKKTLNKRAFFLKLHQHKLTYSAANLMRTHHTQNKHACNETQALLSSPDLGTHFSVTCRFTCHRLWPQYDHVTKQFVRFLFEMFFHCFLKISCMHLLPTASYSELISKWGCKSEASQ